ncbi:peptide/nickel transport system substrate-binding protein [Leucobacter komagatae]|uniref:Peptide/nickel transport system substrate-binding protein n=1 Tax=Leucobacter komagatae TaxID=55969 RepID=A0A542XXH7_9MICO|nr:ABC transporter substrate-binding protein [Leucobacter komagatae]TQL40535.1 peptide/nickel transport system substrate-binding protein [Leucobacter komagatae]
MSQRRTVKIAAIALAAALGASLAACAPPGGGDGGDPAGALRIGMVGSSIDEVQPYAQHSSFSNNAVYAQVHEGLTALDNEGAVVYKLAESMTPNEALDVWTVRLRDGVRTHNGEQFTAHDAAESIGWMVDEANGWSIASQLDFIDPDGIAVVDDLTLELSLREPYGPLPEAFSMTRLVMRSLKGNATFDAPAGTGPFRIESFTAGQQAKLTRFDDYWGDPATVENLTFSFFQEQDAVTNAIRGGQIDIAQGIPFPEMPSIEREAGLKILVSDTATYPLMTVRLDASPTDDARVREAMRLVVDRERIVENAFGGYATIGNDFISKNSACPDPQLPQREQDLERAAELLAEAGAAELKLELATDAAFPGMVEMAQLYAEDAAKVGIGVSVKKLDVGTFLNQWLEWPFFIGFTSTPYLVSATGHFSPGGSENGSHMDDPEYNEIAAKLYATADPEAQCDYISQLRTIEYERGGYIIPVYGQDITVHSDRVSGLRTDLYGRSAYTLDGVTIDQ